MKGYFLINSPRWALAVAINLLLLCSRHQMVHGATEYTAEDVATHDSVANGVWVGYNGKVYDLTEWVPRHPGGSDVLLAAAGTIDEFTNEFNDHHGPRGFAARILSRFEIGDLVM